MLLILTIYFLAFAAEPFTEFTDHILGCLMGRLQEAIQSAADQASNAANSSSSSTASDRDRGPSAKHLKPIVTAVEMVFGSAAALSATFGFKVLLLHSTPLSYSLHVHCQILLQRLLHSIVPVQCELAPCV